MTDLPHPDTAELLVHCAILTVSDSRTAATDLSGQFIKQALEQAGHQISDYTLLPDDPLQIRRQVEAWSQHDHLDVIILNGGTGIAPRDTTYDAIATLLEKPLPGFGELFRWLSYQQIGSRAMASRATAGVFRSRLIFALPGSRHGVQLGMEALILPELRHLVQQLRG